jgi:hypothetical protein
VLNRQRHTVILQPVNQQDVGQGEWAYHTNILPALQTIGK